jgi:hypothetical protein
VPANSSASSGGGLPNPVGDTRPDHREPCELHFQTKRSIPKASIVWALNNMVFPFDSLNSKAYLMPKILRIQTYTVPQGQVHWCFFYSE